MKLIILQLSREILYLTPAKNGNRAAFDAPRMFELPQPLRSGGALTNLPAFAEFVKHCVNSGDFNTNHCIVCLEEESVIRKEYQHLPCKPKNLVAFARLEAETVLPDDVEDYLIQNREYGYVNGLTGKLTGVLFAVRSDLVTGIRKAFSHVGLKVHKIVPPMGGLLSAAGALTGTAGKTVAVLDFSLEKTRLLVMHDRHPVFERSFEGIFDDLVEIVQKERSLPFQEAVDAAFHLNMNTDDGEASLSPETMRHISTLLDASADEAARNIRMVLSSERLDLDRILLCGPLASLPNYREFWNSLDLDIPLSVINATDAGAVLPKAEPRALRTGFGPEAFFTLAGILRAKRKDDLDFLKNIRSQSGSTAAQVTVLAVLTALSIGIMALQPFLNFMKARQLAQDEKDLSNPAYTEIQRLKNQEDKLFSEVEQQKSDRAMLPYGKSNSEEIVKQILEQVTAKGGTVLSCTVDQTSGNVSLTFAVSNFETYLSIKHNIESNGFFTIAVPFSAVVQTAGSYQCSVTLSPKNYTAWKTSGKGGAAP
ncbi:hypothetical protein [Caproiciproducens sp. LBM24188]